MGKGTFAVERVVDSCAGRRDDVVVVHGERCVTGAELAELVYRLGAALREIGVDLGCLVVIRAQNSPEVLAVRLATQLIGGCAAIVPAHTDDELIAGLAPNVLVSAPNSGQTGAYTLGEAPGCVDLLAMARNMPATAIGCPASGDDVCSVVLSGGTTGRPKASCHTYTDQQTVIAASSDPQPRLLVATPLAYLAQNLVDAALADDGMVVLLAPSPVFDPDLVLTAITRHHITNMFLVEPQLFALATHPELSRYDISSLRRLLHLGAAAPATARRVALERLGPILCHAYGSSETGLVSMLGPEQYTPDRLDTAGPILPDARVRFTRPDGTPGDHGEPCDIAVTGPHIASGYWRRPDLDAIIADGWISTGDVGFIDDNDDLHILGRRRDIIANVFPAQVEDLLYQQPGVRLASAFADTNQFRALVVLEPDAAFDPPAVLTALQADLDVAVTVVAVDRIPLTEQGKPDQQATRMA
ncbi:class I adenylate-forming enzyme family protein [Nocardia sp. NPDC051052]|uniref:class I adenylate-forming enzyme family protein n=1 Tax=Nocardia sp. NPDC051052 TaxID=3364322 RepID=UPI0037BA4718